MVLLTHEIRVRDDNEVLLIDRVGYLDCPVLTTVITSHKEFTLLTNWKFAQGLPGIGAIYSLKRR